MSINKQKLLDILGSPKDISDKDLEELENVVQQYPYFQLGYSLIAKAKYDRQAPDAYDSLSIAAIYAPDRIILKKIFYDNLCIDAQVTYNTDDSQAVANAPADLTPPEPTESNQIEEDEQVIAAEMPTESDAAPEEEQESISAPEQTQIVQEETDTPKIGIEEDEQVIAAEMPTESDAAPEEEQESISASEQTQIVQEETDTPKMGGEIEIMEAAPGEQRVSIEKKEKDEAVYRELEENLKNLRANKLKFDDEEEDTESSDKKKTINETVLPENEETNVEISSPDDKKNTSTEKYKSSREKGTTRLITEISSLEPLPSDQIKTKQQTQFSLIDKFISTEPEIVYKDQGALNVQLSDLSEKSTLTRNYLLTENFAAIMLKQGKIDKAIEIYRKLIWKFPQKKAYFAARIKALKERE